MNNQNQTTPPDLNQKIWGVGILSNILFIVFQLFPLFSLNGVTLHSDYRFFVMGAGIVTLVLRILKKEKYVTAASIITVLLCVILYVRVHTGLQSMAISFSSGGSGASINFLTALLILASSVLMIRPSLIAKKLG